MPRTTARHRPSRPADNFASAWICRHGGWARCDTADVLAVGIARAVAGGPIGTTHHGAVIDPPWGGVPC